MLKETRNPLLPAVFHRAASMVTSIHLITTVPFEPRKTSWGSNGEANPHLISLIIKA